MYLQSTFLVNFDNHKRNPALFRAFRDSLFKKPMDRHSCRFAAVWGTGIMSRC